MKVEDFVSYIDNVILKYRQLYKLIEIIAITLLIYTLIVFLSIDNLLTIVPFLESYASYSISLIITRIYFANIFLFFIAFVCAIIITLLLHRMDKKKDTIDIVEKKYPLLHEKLSTAYDNRDIENIIVTDLKNDVENNTANIKDTDFLDKKRMKLSLFLLVISFSLLFYVSISDYRIDTGSQIIDPLIPDIHDKNNIDIIENSTDNNLNQSQEELNSKPSVLVVEGKEVDLTLPPGSANGLNQNGFNNTSMPDNFKQSSAYDVKTISSSTYSENLPEGYENIIKQYFERMAHK